MFFDDVIYQAYSVILFGHFWWLITFGGLLPLMVIHFSVVDYDLTLTLTSP